MSTFALGLVMIIFAALAMDMGARWLPLALFCIGGLFVVANLIFPNSP